MNPVSRFIWLVALTASSLRAQTALALWPGTLSNALRNDTLPERVWRNNILRISKVSVPTLTVYPPDPKQATGTAGLTGFRPPKSKERCLHYQALKRANVSAEMHLYGGHGFGMSTPNPPTAAWGHGRDDLLHWLKSRGL